jgi:hypothetical protein
MELSSFECNQDALDAATEGRTSITIAHRLSTIVQADIIFIIGKQYHIYQRDLRNEQTPECNGNMYCRGIAVEGKTELVQPTSYRGNSHWRTGATSQMTDMVWLHRSPGKTELV